MEIKSLQDNNSEKLQKANVSDYFLLLKPRVMRLVIFTGLIGMLLAFQFGHNIHIFRALIAIFALALGSGAAGAINMWYESDIDAIMKRTCNRPIVTGRVDRKEALDFAVISAIIAVTLMIILVNLIAGILLIAAILFYVYIYTIWLKPRTVQNIVIGGASGAFPPIIGWSAVSGDISLYPILLFLIIFFWTPPHFWSLSLYKSDDYKAANIPMLPVIKGDKVTKINIVIYAIILAVITMLPVIFGFASWLYLATVTFLNYKFISLSVKTYKEKDGYHWARKNFLFSLLYLFILFLSLLLDKFLI